MTISTKQKNVDIKIMNIKPKFKQGIQLLAGKYDIQISKKGYNTYRKWIKISTTTNLEIDLKPQ